MDPLLSRKIIKFPNYLHLNEGLHPNGVSGFGVVIKFTMLRNNRGVGSFASLARV